MEKQKLIVIVGPTSSGKSDLGVALAKKFNGEIVSADSRQVYRGLDIGSGKITKKEMGGIPHHLLDVANIKRRFTVLQYQKKAMEAISKIAKRGHVPFLVGGTGFYVRALVDNIIIPEVTPSQELRNKLNKKSVDDLFLELKSRDPKRARAMLKSSGQEKNKRRIIRALEIIAATGKIIPPLRANEPLYDILMLGIYYSRETLSERIAERLTKRFEDGMTGEIKRLHDIEGVSWKRLEELGLECRWIARYLQGKISENSMKERLLKDIEHFAKRQMTWFNRDKNIEWLSPENAVSKAERRVLAFLAS